MSVNEIVAQAYLYVERGWAVIPTKPGGKAPIGMNWQNSGRRTRAEIDATWTANPDAGVGILTGRPSGFWVLDVDPVNGGDKQLAGLIQAYGRLPETYTVATPSGGTHYYFLMPDDFEPTNAPGRLPEGIDVRGTGGQVLAPPTMRGDRRYAVLTDLPLARCAQWVLELIVPVEHEPRQLVDDSAWTSAGPGAGGMLDRGHAYAMAAVQALLGDLTLATAGSRNREAYRVSVRLVELVNSPWSGLDAEAVFGWYLQAAAACGLDQDLPRGQPERAWASALRAKAGAGVGLPEAEFYGSVLPFEALGVSAAGFSSPGTATSSVTTPMPATGAALGLTFVDPATIDESMKDNPATPAVVQAPVDAVAAAREFRIQEEMSRIWYREEARRRLDELGRVDTDWATELLDERGIEGLADPEWLIDGYLIKDTLARVIGASGSFKSFIMLDMAACIGSGRSWHGSAVAKGLVVFCAAEGASGVKKRLRAWRARHETSEHGVLVLPRPVQIGGSEWASFVRHMQRLAPALVVFDTQARVTVGRNENDAREMGEVIAHLDELRVATGACVAVVHHTGKSGDERGSTAPFGATNTSLSVKRINGGLNVEVSGSKQKDDPDALPVKMTMTKFVDSLVPIGLGERLDDNGQPVFGNPADQDVGRTRLEALVSVLRDQFAEGNGGTKAEIKAAYMAHADMVSLHDATRKRAWFRNWGRLEALWRLAQNPAVPSRFKFAEVDGLGDLEPNPDRLSDFGWPILKSDSP